MNQGTILVQVEAVTKLILETDDVSSLPQAVNGLQTIISGKLGFYNKWMNGSHCNTEEDFTQCKFTVDHSFICSSSPS